jgi:hypothetical protein
VSAGSAGESAAPHIFLVAGEPSGDVLGGRLMAALKRATQGRARFSGVGGERMASEGLDSLFALDDIAVMGRPRSCPVCRAFSAACARPFAPSRHGGRRSS